MVILEETLKSLSSHFKRVVKYARPSDYAAGAVSTVAGPGLLLLWERIAPSHVGKGGFAPILRLTTAVSAGAGFLLFYNRSIRKAFCSFFIKKSIISGEINAHRLNPFPRRWNSPVLWF